MMADFEVRIRKIEKMQYIQVGGMGLMTTMMICILQAVLWLRQVNEITEEQQIEETMDVLSVDGLSQGDRRDSFSGY